METMEAIARRKSTRDFEPRQLPENVLQKILGAAYAAPIGLNEYNTMHLTVVQNAAILETLREAASKAFAGASKNVFYGAPTLVIVSSSGGTVPEIAMANAACMVENIMLAATDLGVDCVYIWSIVPAFRIQPPLARDIALPQGFRPFASVALGYATQPDLSAKDLTQVTIQTNRI